MQITIIGTGRLGGAVADAGTDRGDVVRLLGRPVSGTHPPSDFVATDLVVEASVGSAVRSNVASALDAGVRRFAIATTGWEADRPIVERDLIAHGATAVVAANFSLGVSLFGRLVDVATELFGASEAFDPYLVEWHRRGKTDRPSGTARALAERIVAHHPRVATPADLETVSIRAGASPGMHLVGFDAVGETVELRLTARDRSAYAAGILASADWLARIPRTPGIHPFDPVVDELLARRAVAA